MIATWNRLGSDYSNDDTTSFRFPLFEIIFKGLRALNALNILKNGMSMEDMLWMIQVITENKTTIRSSIFHESLRYVPFPMTKPITIIFKIASPI